MMMRRCFVIMSYFSSNPFIIHVSVRTLCHHLRNEPTGTLERQWAGTTDHQAQVQLMVTLTECCCCWREVFLWECDDLVSQRVLRKNSNRTNEREMNLWRVCVCGKQTMGSFLYSIPDTRRLTVCTVYYSNWKGITTTGMEIRKAKIKTLWRNIQLVSVRVHVCVNWNEK